MQVTEMLTIPETNKDYDIFTNDADIAVDLNINGQDYTFTNITEAYQNMAHNEQQHSEQILQELLLCKFTQHPILLKALLDTDQKAFIEAADSSQTSASSLPESAKLSIILAKVRAQLQQELQEYQSIRIRVGLSDQLAEQLNMADHQKNSQYQDKYHTHEQINNYPVCLTLEDFKRNTQIGSEINQDDTATDTLISPPKTHDATTSPTPALTISTMPMQHSHAATSVPPAPDKNDLRNYCQKDTFKNKSIENYTDENQILCRRIIIKQEKSLADVLVYSDKITCQQPEEASIATMATLMKEAKAKEVLLKGEADDIEKLAAKCHDQGLIPYVLNKEGKAIKYSLLPKQQQAHTLFQPSGDMAQAASTGQLASKTLPIQEQPIDNRPTL